MVDFRVREVIITVGFEQLEVDLFAVQTAPAPNLDEEMLFHMSLTCI
jgi:hypothetical protein